ncbi:hypothetical protein IT575_09605 [bacterium]|nr:hypothetical protein [bacterium]
MPELPSAIAALIKVFSLGYLLTLLGLGAAALLWRFLRPRLAPGLRAEAGFSLIAGTWLLNTLLAAGIWWGVVNYKILMTTNHFHHLMYGGWANGITGTGLMVFGLSLMLLAWGWQRGTVPEKLRDGAALGSAALGAGRSIPLRAARGIATAALVGVVRPEIWVNPAYWDTLSAAQRELAIAHELVHLRRADNLRKLLLACIGGLFAVIPGARAWSAQYEQDSELAVDSACRRSHDEDAYRGLIAGALDFLLGTAQAGGSAATSRQDKPALGSVAAAVSGAAPLQSSLGRLLRSRSALAHGALLERLRLLAQPPDPAAQRSALRLLPLALLLLTCAHSLALLSHPLPRCLLACYLGY